MATKQRSRSRTRRSGSSRDRTPRYVAPVLDPTWQSPYSPSAAERAANAHALRRFALRRRLPQAIVVGVLAVVLLAGAFLTPWSLLAALVVIGLFVIDTRRYLATYEQRGGALGALLLESFQAGGSTKDRQRLLTVLERMTATFGVDNVSAFIVDDVGYNAALIPNGSSLALFVTSALVRDFDLIELEGVVAHCLARQRLGLLGRQSLASLSNLTDAARRALAAPGSSYRADEVAAAAIRYPLGIAGALRRCAASEAGEGSFFRGDRYRQTRYVWFNAWADRATSDLGDLDDVTLRAQALEEW